MKSCKTGRRLNALCGLLLLVFMSPASGSTEEFLQLETLDGVIGKWKGFQAGMNNQGIILETTNTLDVLSNVAGGRRRKTAVTGDLDLLLTVNIQKIVSGWGGTLFVYGLGVYGDNPSTYVGDIQGVSNIAAANSWKLFEAWYQHNLFERFSLLAGLYDVTSEFDVIVSASELFVNSSFGTGAELAAGGKNGPPTFPTTSLGVRAQAIVTDSLMIRAVLADGVPGNPDNPHDNDSLWRGKDGIFSTMELAYYQFRKVDITGSKRDILKDKPRRLTFRRVGRSAPLEYEAKVALGIWGYTTSLDHLSNVNSSGAPVKVHGTYGMYGLAEYDVFHEKEDTDQELTIFGRVGMADPRVNRFSQYYGGGLVYTGLFPGRNFDQTGIGVAAALNGKYFKQAQQMNGQRVDTAEITLEATHSIFVNSHLIIQPDVQYIMNPGTVPGRNNALVLGVRLEFNFNWFNPPSTTADIFY